MTNIELPELPASMYGHEAGSNEHVWEESLMRAYGLSCYAAGVKAERKRAEAIAQDEARIRDEAGRTHPEGSAARDRCWAGARAATNVAVGIRNGEVVAAMKNEA